MRITLIITLFFVFVQNITFAQNLDSTDYFEDSIQPQKWRYGIQLSGYKNTPFTDINSFYSTSYAFDRTNNELDNLESGVGKSAAYIFYFDVTNRIVASAGVGLFSNDYTLQGHLNDSITLPPDYNYSKITQKIKYHSLFIPLDIQFYWKKGNLSIFNTVGFQYNLLAFNNNTIETQVTDNRGSITFASEFITQKLPKQNIYFSAGVDINLSRRHQLRIEPFYMLSIDNNIDINTSATGLKAAILVR